MSLATLMSSELTLAVSPNGHSHATPQPHAVGATDNTPQQAPATEPDNPKGKPADKDSWFKRRKKRRQEAKQRRSDEEIQRSQTSEEKRRVRQEIAEARRQERHKIAADNASLRMLYVVGTGLSIVVLCSFVVAFTGMFDFGIRVGQLHPVLAVAAALSVEGLTICTIGATYALRHAPWRMRVFAWFVFVVPLALSVAGNVGHARERGLSISGQVAAGISPMLLALGMHTLVVVARYLEKVKGGNDDAKYDSPSVPPIRPVDDPKPTASRQEPVKPDAITVTSMRAPKAVAKSADGDNEPQKLARKLAAKGKATSDIKYALKRHGYEPSERTIQRWTADIRDKENN